MANCRWILVQDSDISSMNFNCVEGYDTRPLFIVKMWSYKQGFRAGHYNSLMHK